MKDGIRKGMKVLLISSEFPPGPGGIGHHAFSLSKALGEKGVDLRVLTVSDYASRQETERFDHEHRISILRYPRVGKLTYLNRLRICDRICREDRFDWILLTGKFSLWTGIYLKYRFPKCRTIAILHGSEVRPSGGINKRLTEAALSKADILISVSVFTATLVPDECKKGRDIHIIPNGIDLPGLDTLPMAPASALQGTPRLLTVGHVSPRKGQHRVIRALPELVKRFPNVHYHIVGRPITKDRLQKLSEELGVKNHVTFHGVAATQADLARFYACADIFLLLSENQPDGDVEGFGIVALEANHYGMPVIGARHCGVEDAVQHGKSGFLVDGDEDAEICAAVEACMENRETLSEGARSWAAEHSWDSIVEDYLGIMS